MRDSSPAGRRRVTQRDRGGHSLPPRHPPGRRPAASPPTVRAAPAAHRGRARSTSSPWATATAVRLGVLPGTSSHSARPPVAHRRAREAWGPARRRMAPSRPFLESPSPGDPSWPRPPAGPQTCGHRGRTHLPSPASASWASAAALTSTVPALAPLPGFLCCRRSVTLVPTAWPRSSRCWPLPPHSPGRPCSAEPRAAELGAGGPGERGKGRLASGRGARAALTFANVLQAAVEGERREGHAPAAPDVHRPRTFQPRLLDGSHLTGEQLQRLALKPASLARARPLARG